MSATSFRIREVACVLALLAAAYWPLFYKLDAQPLHPWDEAFTAVQALEMQTSDNWLVPTFEHRPDLLNTKPPLMTWLSALCMAVLGPSELAVRLPSALAGLATVLLLYGIGTWGLGNRLLGLAAAGILLTSPAYTGYHITRSGDTDALLTLWTTLACWACYRWSLRPTAWAPLLTLAAAFVLMIYTKSVQGLLIVPGLVVFLLIGAGGAGRLRPLLSGRVVPVAAGALALCLGYYLLREVYESGYIARVARAELFNRFTDAYDRHSGPLSYYLELGARERYVPWFWLLPLALGALVLRRRSDLPTVGWHAFPALGYLLLISVARTKAEWYDAPLYPLLALGVVALVVEPALQQLSTRREPVALVLLGLVLLLPYRASIQRVEHAERPLEWYAVHYATYLERLQRERPQIRRLWVPVQEFNPSLYFHRERLLRDVRPPLELVVVGARLDQPPPDLKAGQWVLTCEPALVPWLARSYRMEIEHEWQSNIANVHPFQTWRIVQRLDSVADTLSCR